MNNLQQLRRVMLIAFAWFALFFASMAAGIWLAGERDLEWGFLCGILLCYVATVVAGLAARLLILRGWRCGADRAVNAAGLF